MNNVKAVLIGNHTSFVSLPGKPARAMKHAVLLYISTFPPSDKKELQLDITGDERARIELNRDEVKILRHTLTIWLEGK